MGPFIGRTRTDRQQHYCCRDDYGSAASWRGSQPCPVPSQQAARRFARGGVSADLIYLDASHDKKEVYADLRAYYLLLRDGGIIFGDDYKGWPGVKSAVDAFCWENYLTYDVEDEIFWVIRKGK